MNVACSITHHWIFLSWQTTEDLETTPTSPNLSSSSPDSEEAHLLDLSPRPKTPPAPASDPSDSRSVFIEMAGAHVLVAAHYLQEKGRSMVCSEVRRSFSVFFFLFLFSLLFPFLFLSDYIIWYRCLLLVFIFLLPHVPFHRSRDLS